MKAAAPVQRPSPARQPAEKSGLPLPLFGSGIEDKYSKTGAYYELWDCYVGGHQPFILFDNTYGCANAQHTSIFSSLGLAIARRLLCSNAARLGHAVASQLCVTYLHGDILIAVIDLQAAAVLASFQLCPNS